MHPLRVHLADPMPYVWSARAAEHRARIQRTLPGTVIEHIGSTAIGGIRSKDVVDLLVGVPSEAGSDAFSAAVERLTTAGYVIEGLRPGHSWLCWPHQNHRLVIVHVVVAGSAEWHRRVSFRDVLKSDSRLAAEYERLKDLASSRAADWDDYTSMKAAFVREVLSGRL